MYIKLLDSTGIAIALCLLVSIATTRLIGASPNGQSHGGSDVVSGLLSVLNSTEFQNGLQSVTRKLFVPKSELDKSNKDTASKSKKDKAKKKDKKKGWTKTDSNTGSKSGEYLADCLEAHNKYRRLHNAPDLEWSNTVCIET